jgi:hypothetical protein
VHDDVQLCQWLRTRDGTIKLGDFNRAEVMNYNMEKKEYCRYSNGQAYGNVSVFERQSKTSLTLECLIVLLLQNNLKM